MHSAPTEFAHPSPDGSAVDATPGADLNRLTPRAVTTGGERGDRAIGDHAAADAMPATRRSPARHPRVAILDGLRLVAALMVVSYPLHRPRRCLDGGEPTRIPGGGLPRIAVRILRRRAVLPDQWIRHLHEWDGPVARTVLRRACRAALPGVLVCGARHGGRGHAMAHDQSADRAHRRRHQPDHAPDPAPHSERRRCLLDALGRAAFLSAVRARRLLRRDLSASRRVLRTVDRGLRRRHGGWRPVIGQRALQHAPSARDRAAVLAVLHRRHGVLPDAPLPSRPAVVGRCRHSTDARDPLSRRRPNDHAQVHRYRRGGRAGGRRRASSGSWRWWRCTSWRSAGAGSPSPAR